MNIGFCVSHLFGGGAERVVTSLANTLSQLGHNVTANFPGKYVASLPMTFNAILDNFAKYNTI